MNIEKVLKLLIREYDKASISYALIGGFAIGLQGVDRATVDIDFLLKKENYKGENVFWSQWGIKMYLKARMLRNLYLYQKSWAK